MMVMRMVWIVVGLMGSVLSAAQAEEFTATVVSVPSGYILELETDGQKSLAALDGVTCPWSSSPIGSAAKAFTAGQILHQPVSVRIVEKTEKLLYVNVVLPGGADLADELLRKGFAAWNGRARGNFARYQELERKARDEGLGMWAPEEPQAPKSDVPQDVRPADISSTRASVGEPSVNLRSYGTVSEPGLPHTLVLRGNLPKDYSLEESINQSVAEERERNRMARQQALLDREQQITQRGHSLARKKGSGFQSTSFKPAWGGGGGGRGGFGGAYSGYGY